MVGEDWQQMKGTGSEELISQPHICALIGSGVRRYSQSLF